MTPMLIILALLILAVALVFLVTRNKAQRPYEQRHDQDTAWNDPPSGGADTDRTPGPRP